MKKNQNQTAGPSREDKAIEQFVEMMISKLETIKSDWKKPWFTKGALIWPQNFTGRKYNGMNALMLTMQADEKGYELPVWCTFDRVVGLNGHKNSEGKWCPEVDENGERLQNVCIKKGEKSFPVFVTVKSIVNSETKERISVETYNGLDDDERKNWNVYPKLQVYNVFNIAQTNLDEVRPELFEKIRQRIQGSKVESEPIDDWCFPAMDEVIENSKPKIVTPLSWVCPIVPTYGDDAYYSISKDTIVIPEKKQFKDGQSFYENVFHEMAHSTGAESRLNRLKPSSFGSKEYAREELVAELTAALVGIQFGMEKTIKEDSVPYLRNWLERLKEQPSFIKTVLMDVRRAASMIIQHIEKVQSQDDSEENR